MSYTNATFFLDYEGGSDAARADLVPTAYANNGSGLVRVTCNSTAAYATGAVFDIAGTTGSVYVGGWIVTIVDGTHVDLQGSTFTVNPAAKGTMIPRGGSQKTDAWKTITSGATSARTAAGDTVRVMGSPAATSLGINGTWTDVTLTPSNVSITSSTNATPIVVTLSGPNYTLLAPAVGDTVLISSHTTNTNANGIWKISAVNGSSTFTIVNANGTNSVGNGVGGATGTVTKITGGAVILASAITKAIACVGNRNTKTNWTSDGGANVVCSVNTSDFKEGGECQSIAIGSGFATGLAAHFATGTLDLSAYQQVTFWIKQTAGTVAVANDCRLELSTNATGTAVVHNIPVPALAALNQWVPVTVDLATNMNTGIASIGWNQLVDRGAQTFLVDCVTACKASSSADSLTLTSLIGKNAAGDTWFGIQSINDVRVLLDFSANQTPGTNPRYSGTTEAVTTYKRETIPTTMVAAAGTAVQTFQQNGSSGNLVSFEGGWDRTNMTTQNLETWFDGRNCLGVGLYTSTSRSFLSFNKLKTVRYSVGCIVDNGSADITIDNLDCNNNAVQGFQIAATTGTTQRIAIGTIYCRHNQYGFQADTSGNDSQVAACTATTMDACSNRTVNVSLGDSTNAYVISCQFGTVKANNCAPNVGVSGTGVNIVRGSDHQFGTVTASGNAISGVIIQGVGRHRFKSLTANSNGGNGATGGGYGIAFTDSESQGTVVLSGSTASNVNGSIYVPVRVSGPVAGAWNYFRNWTASEATVVSAPPAFRNSGIFIEKYGGTAGDNRIFTDGGSGSVGAIYSQTAVRHTASGIAWCFAPTSANRQAYYPLQMVLATFAVKANKAISLSCYIRRDNTSALVAKMVVLGGQIAGIANDVSVTASGAINTWANESLATMTPTEDGVIQVVAQVYGGTTNNAYFDDIQISQAA